MSVSPSEDIMEKPITIIQTASFNPLQRALEVKIKEKLAYE